MQQVEKFVEAEGLKSVRSNSFGLFLMVVLATYSFSEFVYLRYETNGLQHLG